MITIPTLMTTRLIIRPLNEKDIDFLFNHYNQEEILRYTLISFNSIDEVKTFLDQYAKRDMRKFKEGIELRSTHQLIGTVTFLNWSKNDRCAEVGYDLSKEYWGKGLMLEALEVFIKFGFEVMNLNRIEATSNVRNERSRKVLTRLGFVQEGILRQKYRFRGKFSDEMIFSILREEWKTRGNQGIQDFQFHKEKKD
ncbi:MAG: GNAT family N-acetyltransferase [Promethearchaeota archaeon]